MTESRRKRQQKKSGKRKIGMWRIVLAVVLFIVAGLLFMLEPYKNYLIKQGQEANTIGNLTRDQIKANEQKEVTYDFDDIKQLNAFDVVRDHVNPNDLPVVGGLAIPSVKMNLPIYKGVSNEGMYLGAGTLIPDQKMGESNYAVASHHSIHKELLFAPLEKVAVGDTVYLTDLDKVYKYEVFFREQVTPTRVDLIEPTEQAIVTMVTCDSSLQDRIVVQAKFIEETPLAKAGQDVVDAFNIDQTVPTN